MDTLPEQQPAAHLKTAHRAGPSSHQTIAPVQTKIIRDEAGYQLIRIALKTSQGWVKIYRYSQPGVSLVGSPKTLRSQLRTWSSARGTHLSGGHQALKHLNLLD